MCELVGGLGCSTPPAPTKALRVARGPAGRMHAAALHWDRTGWLGGWLLGGCPTPGWRLSTYHLQRPALPCPGVLAPAATRRDPTPLLLCGALHCTALIRPDELCCHGAGVAGMKFNWAIAAIDRWVQYGTVPRRGQRLEAPDSRVDPQNPSETLRTPRPGSLGNAHMGLRTLRNPAQPLESLALLHPPPGCSSTARPTWVASRSTSAPRRAAAARTSNRPTMNSARTTGSRCAALFRFRGGGVPGPQTTHACRGRPRAAMRNSANGYLDPVGQRLASWPDPGRAVAHTRARGSAMRPPGSSLMGSCCPRAAACAAARMAMPKRGAMLLPPHAFAVIPADCRGLSCCRLQACTACTACSRDA